MKKTILAISMITAFLSATAQADNSGIYLKLEGNPVQIDKSRKIDGSTFPEKFVKSYEKPEFAIKTGVEFALSDSNENWNGYVEIGYKNKYTAHTAIFGGGFLYKNGPWRYMLGGYFGVGIDQSTVSGFDEIVQNLDGSTKTVHYTNAKNPTFLNTGFELGAGYQINDDWAIDTKLVLDGKDYKMKPNYDKSENVTATADSILFMKLAETKAIQVNSVNVAVSLNYYF